VAVNAEEKKEAGNNDDVFYELMLLRRRKGSQIDEDFLVRLSYPDVVHDDPIDLPRNSFIYAYNISYITNNSQPFVVLFINLFIYDIALGTY